MSDLNFCSARDEFSATISPEQVADHYDELDAYYRELWGEHVHHGLWQHPKEDPAVAVLNLVNRVAESGAVRRGAKVLDIGCGYGGTARLLARHYGAHVTAVTISRKQFEFAQSSDLEPLLQFYHADWNNLEVPESSFDCAIAIESSEHMPDQRTFYQRAFRALRPGGRLVVCAWLSAPRPSRWQQKYLLEPICREGRMPRLLSAEEIEQIGAEAGFSTGQVQDLSRQVSPTWGILVKRLARQLVANPAYRAFVLNSRSRNRVFALTLGRIWLAYQVRAMGYGLFVFVRPEGTA